MACAPGANPFIERYFLDCVYNLRDYVGFCLGLAAIIFWIVAQIPQWVKNYRTKKAEALSPWFLAQWLLGDTFNLLGCLLQGQQLPTTTYTAMYFVVADVFMMMQYIYYGALQRRKEKLLTLQARRRNHHRRHHDRSGTRSRTPSGDQQWQKRSDESSKYVHQQQQQQQQQQLPQQQDGRRWQDAPSSCYDVEYGIDGCTKQQQQQMKQQTEHADSAVIYKQHWQASLSSVAPVTCAGYASSNTPAYCSPEPVTGAAAALQHTSCSLQAGAAAAASSSSSEVKQLAGIGSLGVNRSVIGVGVLVGLGLISLLIPATSTHGLFPSSEHTVGAVIAAHPRSLEAGIPMASHIHSVSSSTGSKPPGVFAAALSSAIAYSSGSDGGSSSDPTSGGEEPVDPSPRDWAFVVGTGLGYVASVLYLCSRFSQIHKNYTRQSSEGLALAMFMMAVCANLCTGVGIVMRTFTWQQFHEQLPWIIGSLGTICLDMIILCQSVRYGKQANSSTAGTAAERQQLMHVHHHHSHVHGMQHHQQHIALRPGHAAAGGVGGVGTVGVVVASGVGTTTACYHSSGAGSSSSSSRIAIPAAAGVSSGENVAWLSSSAPVEPAWRASSQRAVQGGSTAGRRQAVATTAVHVDPSEVTAPLLQ